MSVIVHQWLFVKGDRDRGESPIKNRKKNLTIRESYNRVLCWIDSQELLPAGNPRESYIDGIWNKEEEADWLTELQVPVKQKEE